MNLLVIGASGQVGRAIMDTALRIGLQATGASRSPGPLQVRLDLTDLPSISKAFEETAPETVVLCSAMTAVDACEKDPSAARAVNVEGTAAVAAACLATGAKLVYLSTEYVFDGKAGPYSEEAAPAPISVYGRTKYEGEQLALRAPGALAIRTTVVYSFDPAGKNFVMQLLENSKKGVKMNVPRDQVSNPTYAPELARFILELAGRGKSGVYNAVGADRLDRYAFGKLACETLGLDASILTPVATAELGQAAARPLQAGLLTAKLESELGRPPSPARESLLELKELAFKNGYLDR